MKKKLESFLKLHEGKVRIAFSGGSDGFNDETVLSNWIKTFLEKLPKEKVLLITGGTKGGLPGISTDAGNYFHIPVIGVVPLRAKTEDIHPNLSYLVRVPPQFDESNWGDESEVFVKLAHAMICVGGKWGTAIEFTRAMSINEANKRKNLSAKKIAVVECFGGFSSAVRTLPHTTREYLLLSKDGNHDQLLTFFCDLF